MRLGGTVFDSKVVRSLAPAASSSDLLTYWRHDFHAYARAHAPGGSHAVDGNGRHPGGTLHVNHERVVLATHGTVPGLLGLGAEGSPEPGAALVRQLVAVVPSEHPVEPGEMAARMGRTTDIKPSH